MITAALALAGSLALALYPGLAESGLERLLLFGGAATLLLGIGLALGWPMVVPWAVAILGSQLVVSLYVRNLALDVTAAAYGAGLLLVAELAYWSLELRLPSQAEPGLVRRRLMTLACIVLISAGVGVVAALLSRAPMAGSLGLLAIGLGAVVAALALVVSIAWPSGAQGENNAGRDADQERTG